MRHIALTFALGGFVILHAQDPLVMEAGRHRILYAPGSEALAVRAANVIRTTSDAAAIKYGTTFEGFRAEVRLQLPGRGLMHSRSGPYSCCLKDIGEGVTIATITYDEPMETEQDDVVLATAFMPLAYLTAQSERGRGWLFNDAPEWFVEGLAALDARYHAGGTPQSARTALRRWARQNADSIECCGTSGRTLFLPDQALGGAAFLAYLADRFGEDVHARIVRSTAPSFTRAFAEETRPFTMKALFDGFLQWR